jgi:hypothetical protein
MLLEYGGKQQLLSMGNLALTSRIREVFVKVTQFPLSYLLRCRCSRPSGVIPHLISGGTTHLQYGDDTMILFQNNDFGNSKPEIPPHLL